MVGCAGQPESPRAAVFAPRDWVATPAPKLGSTAARCANWADDAWSVSLSSGGDTVIASPTVWPPDTDTIPVVGGKLAGRDRGEFGGDISWIPDSGPTVQFSTANLHAFMQTRMGLLALVSPASHGHGAGQVVRLEQAANKAWTTVPLMALGGTPAAFRQLADSGALVVTYDELITADFPGTTRVVHRNPVWSSSIPTSVVRDAAGVFYIGMRSGVARLRPQAVGYLEEWLVPAGCAVRVPSGSSHCTCRP